MGPWLEDGDTIVASEWFVADDDGLLTIYSDSHTDTTATVWVTGGGPPGRVYRLRNKITTAAGLVELHTLFVRMREL